jgi:hypothetical protein
MAIRYAIKNGNWSDPTTWDGATTLPTSADDVRSNNFTVTADVNTLTTTPANGDTVISFSYQVGKVTATKNGSTFTAFTATNGTSVTLDVAANGTDVYVFSNAEWEVVSVGATPAGSAVAGGTLVLTNGITLKATSTSINGIISNGSVFIDFNLPSPNQATIYGNVTMANNLGGNMTTVINSSSGTLNIYGNIQSGVNRGGDIVINTSSGILNILGTIVGGSSNTASNAVTNSGSGTINILTGSTLRRSQTFFGPGAAVLNSSTGIINVSSGCTITGINVNGVVGLSIITNSNIGTVNINSDIYGGNGHYAVVNNFSGTLNVQGTVYAGIAYPAIGPGSTSQLTFLTGPFIGHPNGTQANIAAAWRWNLTNPATYIEVYSSDLLDTTPRTLYTADFVGGNPSVADVRLGTTFGPVGELTGTMAVPDPITVSKNTPVDDTVGTAAISAEELWSYPLASMTVPGSIGARLRHVLTTQVLSQYLVAFGAYGDGEVPPAP